MRMLAAGLIAAAACLTVVTPGAGAQGADPRTPRPAHERLAVFEGTWRNADPAEANRFVETCEWLEGGRRHLICRPRWTTPSGPTQHQTIYSYRGRDSTYLVTTFLATGGVWRYHGRPDGNRWIFDLQPDRPDPPQRLRMILTVAADTIRFVEESSERGGPWQVTEDYRHVRVIPDSFTTTAEFPVQGVTLRARIHVAQGPGPHPTIVEVKGFQQADGWVAPAAPAQGYNGVSLDFRGQNASGGRYSPEYTPADLAGLVALLRTDRARREWRVDPARLVVVGTSAGTLAALSTLADDPGVACGGAVVPFNWGVPGAAARADSGVRRQFERVAAGVSAERVRLEPDMVGRIIEQADAINARAAAARLTGKTVFLVGAQRDETAPLMLHFQPLVAAARASGAVVRDTVVNDTHMIGETWQEVLATLFRWVGSDCLGG